MGLSSPAAAAARPEGREPTSVGPEADEVIGFVRETAAQVDRSRAEDLRRSTRSAAVVLRMQRESRIVFDARAIVRSRVSTRPDSRSAAAAAAGELRRDRTALSRRSGFESCRPAVDGKSRFVIVRPRIYAMFASGVIHGRIPVNMITAQAASTEHCVADIYTTDAPLLQPRFHSRPSSADFRSVCSYYRPLDIDFYGQSIGCHAICSIEVTSAKNIHGIT